MIFDTQFLNTLSAQANASPRLRQAYDLRNTPEDNSQGMLNALEPGAVMPVHRHRKLSETVVIVRGSLIERFYDEDGNVTEEVLMAPLLNDLNDLNSSTLTVPMVQVEKGRWHSLECLEPDTVLFESKDGKYEPLAEEDIMK